MSDAVPPAEGPSRKGILALSCILVAYFVFYTVVVGTPLLAGIIAVALFTAFGYWALIRGGYAR